MKNEISQRVKELGKARKFRKGWHKVATALASVAVFCTTYALILPAITMEKDPVCGFEAHEHGESCYAEQTVTMLQCSPEIPEGYGISHSHEEICYDADGNLICTLEQTEEHAHSDACYAAVDVPCELEETKVHTHGDGCFANQQTLTCELEENEEHTHCDECYISRIVQVCELEENECHTHDAKCSITNSTLECTLEEVPGHTHGDSCFANQETLTCELEENEEHAHSDACYTSQAVQVCELEETEGHTHSEECYLTETQMICTLEESQGHTHSDACTGVQNELSCGKAETVAHQHDESCLVTETTQVLNCELPEHTHEDACYPLEEEESISDYLCGSGEHIHSDSCNDEAGNLTCTIPEHMHSAACVLADYDNTADLETYADWEVTLNDVELTGDWAVDVLAIAKTQLGYQESARNVILTEDGHLKGYTRYGAWYGAPYSDWCALFVSFCLEYADVDTEAFPQDEGCNSWIEKLAELEIYFTPDVYTPVPGDLIFFDWDNDGLSDHVGLVAELIPATEETPAQIKDIEGNTNDQVQYMTYDMDDATIMGYGALPENDNIPKTLVMNDVTIMGYGALPENDNIPKTLTYTATVTYDEMAQLPEGVELAVEEILPDTEEYNEYYQQTLAAMVEKGVALTQEDLNISFLRFFDITFVVDGQKIEPEAPVDIQITCSEGITIGEEESTSAIHFAQDGIEFLNVETSQTDTQDEELVDTFTFTPSSSGVVGVVTYEVDDIGLNNNSNAKFYINRQKDAFTTNPKYANYYNANSPLGTAGSFHLVGFGTVTLNTHCNGNVLANTLIAGSNFGTNGYPYELSYVQNYNQVNSNSASKAEGHILVVGSGNTIGTRDNNNQITINSTGIEKPYVVIQDQDTATTPFIDLDRVEAEINQIAETLARYPDMNYIIPAVDNNSQDIRVVLNDPDAVAVLNVPYNDRILFGDIATSKGGIKLDGFKQGHSGTIVINVDCTGATGELSLPQARILVDGQEISTSEVVEFSAGKVVWNFLNADGLTIKTKQMTGMIIAPGATVDIGQNLNGTVVAENIIVNAESHRTDFTGEITPRDVSHDLSIHKYREGYAATTLPGAVFNLYRWNGDRWVLVMSNIETDAAGQFTFQQNALEIGVAYWLVETKAPVGYDSLTEPYYFWLKNTNAGATTLTTAPENFIGVAVEKGGVLNVPNKLSTDTDTIDLNLEKVWAETSDEVSIPKRITIDVYQTAVTKEGVQTKSLYKTVELIPSSISSLNWKMTLSDLPYKDADGTTYSYTVEEVKVDGYIADYDYTDPTETGSGMQISVTITNKPGEEEEGESYELPETGGTGTYGYTLGAIALFAVVLGYSKKKGRREVTAP